LRAAGIHRSAGDLAMAQAHIAQILNMTRPSATLEMQAHTLAAEIAQAMLQPQQAWKHLESLLPSALAGRPEASVRVSYFARRASLALHRHQEQDAVEALVEVVELAPDSPSLLAIQARLSLRRGDPKAAASLFASCLKAIGDPVSARLADLYEIAEAAIELGNWEVLRGIHAAMLRIAPREPAIYWLAARSLAVQAERQRLYPLLDVIRRAPGEQALNQTASLEFEAALDQAAGLAGLDAPAAGPGESMAEAQALIERWLARGRAAFQPNALHAQKLAALTADPEDTAARVACLRNCGDSAAASQAAREASHHPLVLLHLALTLQNEKPRQAMAAIHAAADAISVDSAAARKGESASIAPAARWAAPLIHILTARLFHRNGHRASDYSNALQAVLRALDAWPDEPRWRTLAAEIYLDGAQQGETSARQEATTQLEQAASLDAAHVPTLLLLGQIHLEDGRLPHAIEIFEKAAFAAPEDSQIFLWLARAHRVAGDLDQAAQRAERAVALAPNQAEPLLLRGEIALQANNPRGALSRAQAALRITPENPAGLLLLAQALSALERDDEALVGLEKALALLGEPISLSIERVRLLHRLRGLPAALQAAQQLASRYPDEPAVLGQLAALLDASGDEENAIRAAQRALRDAALAALLAPGDQIALHYLLGRGLRRAGQLDQAVLHLKEAIRLDPEAMDAYLELGRAHLERREYRQALQVFNQAAGLAPTDHRPYYEIGLALKESKDYLGAEKMLRRAAELAPNDLAIHRLLAAVVALNLVHNRREPRESKLTKV
jgi:tetratricopeptide (TPR) repeat protein